jgi:hypothetical protein
MTDIVKRLRSLNDGNRWPMMDEAAEEIERLREEGTVELARLMIENEQLRAVLEEVRAALGPKP